MPENDWCTMMIDAKTDGLDVNRRVMVSTLVPVIAFVNDLTLDRTKKTDGTNFVTNDLDKRYSRRKDMPCTPHAHMTV